LINKEFQSSSEPHLVTCSGYSTTGVLDDCEIPTSLYPLQSKEKTLKEIVQKLLKPFNIGLRIENMEGIGLTDNKQIQELSSTQETDAIEDINKPIDASAADDSQTILSYINELAGQRGILVSHDAYGNLVLLSERTDTPAFKIDDFPGIDFSLKAPFRDLHSEITVQKQADEGQPVEETVTNPIVPVFRPHVSELNSGKSAIEAAKNIRSKELQSIELSFEADRAFFEDTLLQPNLLIAIENRELYLSNSNWFINNVTITGDAEEDKATVNCVLPEVYSGNDPQDIFKI
jgi:prophage tail gpP-like protein